MIHNSTRHTSICLYIQASTPSLKSHYYGSYPVYLNLCDMTNWSDDEPVEKIGEVNGWAAGKRAW